MDDKLAETLINTVRTIVPVGIGLLLHLAITYDMPLRTGGEHLKSSVLALMLVSAYYGWARFLESYLWWPFGFLLGWAIGPDDHRG